jgi:hypothetical protein
MVMVIHTLAASSILTRTQPIAHEGCAGIVAVYLKISRIIIVPEKLLARDDLRHHSDQDWTPMR